MTTDPKVKAEQQANKKFPGKSKGGYSKKFDPTRDSEVKRRRALAQLLSENGEIRPGR